MTDPRFRRLRVFFCRAGADEPAARELYRRVSHESWIEAHLDQQQLLRGQDWESSIELVAEIADAVIVCLTRTSVTKRGCAPPELPVIPYQTNREPGGTFCIIPVRFNESELSASARDCQYIDYFPRNNRDTAYRGLLAKLRDRAQALGILAAHSGAEPSLQRQRPELHPVTQGTGLKAKSQLLRSRITSTRDPVYHFGGIAFAMVPAGRFVMGSQDRDADAYWFEKPPHTVDIPYDYYMARFPVTNEEYAQYAEATHLEHPVREWKSKPDHPVVNVDWDEAVGYCHWLNQLLSAELPFDLQIRLPTEAEWEKAARGTEGWVYAWGNVFEPGLCNSHESGRGHTTAVELHSPTGDSPYGCACMCGNVWEWTHSRFQDYPYRADDGREEQTQLGDVRQVGSEKSNADSRHTPLALGPAQIRAYKSGQGRLARSGLYSSVDYCDENRTIHQSNYPSKTRVARGGSYSETSMHIRCAYRTLHPIDYASENKGFRIAISSFLP